MKLYHENDKKLDDLRIGCYELFMQNQSIKDATKKRIEKQFDKQLGRESGTEDFWTFIQSQPMTTEITKFAKSDLMVRLLAGEKLTLADFGVP